VALHLGPLPIHASLGRSRLQLSGASGHRLLELLLLALICADFCRVVLRLIGADGPFGWDESVYAVRARSWVHPESLSSGWADIRPPLLPLIGTLPMLAGAEEWQFRLIGLISGVGLVLGAWWLARGIAGPIAGVLTAGAVYVAPYAQRESALFLTDVPAAALLVWAMGLLWRELELKPRPGRGLVLAATLGAVAFFMRYGSTTALAPMAITSLALWWRRILTYRRVAVAAAAVLAAAVILHLIHSTVAMGSPLSILRAAREVVSPDRRGNLPIDEYQAYLPAILGGVLGFYLLAAGVGALGFRLADAALRGEIGRSTRAALFLVVTGTGHVLLLVSGVGHAEPRFFLFSTVLFIVAGSAVVAGLVRTLPSHARPLALVIALLAVVAVRSDGMEQALTRAGGTNGYYRPFEILGTEIRDASPDRCGVVTESESLISWYSGCDAITFGRPRTPDRQDFLRADDRWLVVYFRDDAPLLDPDLMAAYMADVVGPPLEVLDPRTGDLFARAWRFAP
jgi:4-amino-4-deoxy-L-arabinose transferase-like glycosyltransferase